MQSAAQYRTYADECRRLAQKLKPEHRDTLTKIADAWDRCADEIAHKSVDGAERDRQR
jgi:hypothetical protein